MLRVSQLFIYPIKSLGGISVETAVVTDRGFQHDRRWMLVDESNRFLTQRVHPQMALLQVSLQQDGLIVQHKKTGNSVHVPFQTESDSYRVKVWSDDCKATEVSNEVSEWFSETLRLLCKLVYMPDTTKRRVDTRYVSNKEITSFSDGYPFSIIGESSLSDLNNRIKDAVDFDRFRPNIVFANGLAYEEDEMAHININSIHFYGVKLLARCIVTTINQQEATKGKEPLQTLATYRTFNNKVYFGQNLVHSGEGVVRLNDEIEVVERKKARLSIN